MRRSDKSRSSSCHRLHLPVSSRLRIGLATAMAWLSVAVGGMSHPLSAQSSSATTDSSAPSSRLNIVWIVADDLSPDLACYGEQLVATPHVDRLSKEGWRFTQAFATSPACSPSRSAFITGFHQGTLGAQHHRTRRKPVLKPDTPTLMRRLQDAGYFVTNEGKTDYNFQPDFRFDGRHWSQRKAGQPFFAQFQIKPPHRDFVRNTDPSRPGKIQLPPHYPDHPVTRVDWANYLQSVELMDQRVGEILQRLKKDQLEDNTAVFFFGDHGRAHVWDKQWLYDGGLKVPLLVRLPGKPPAVKSKLVSLVDLVPTTLSLAGLETPEVMPGQDILATGVKERDCVFAARDRCGDALDRIRSVRTERYKYIRNHHPELPYATRSSYKKLQYPVLTLLNVLHAEGKLTAAQSRFMQPAKPAEELYDLQADPFELTNLAGQAGYEPVRVRLAERLAEWEQTIDLQNGPELPADEMQKLLESKRDWYRKTMRKRGLSPDESDRDYLDWWEQQLGLSK